MRENKISVLDLFLIAYVLMYYGRLSVVLFVPQYAIDNGIPSQYYSLHFAMISVGSAISNLLAIFLLRHFNIRKIFLGIGFISAIYEILLFLYPTPWSLLLAGLLIGLAAGCFWSITFLVICEIIDAHHVPTTYAMSKYNVITTIMSALTPLAAGIIVHWFGYGMWLLSGLGFLIISTAIIYVLKDPIYFKTYGKYPIKEDLSKILKNKRTIITFLLTMLFVTLTVNTWSSFSRVFYTNVGIRDYWLGIMAIIVSVLTIMIYYVLARYKVATRKAIATVGILIFAMELGILTFISDPLIVFILEGMVGAAGIAIVGFATQNIIKNTFRERVYIGRPIFAMGMYVANAAWFAVCGYLIGAYGGFGAIGSILGITVDQFGLRILMVIIAFLAAIWAVLMWIFEGRMIKEKD